MLPFGLECSESVIAIAKEASTLERELIDGGTVVVSCGSGVTLAGLVKGLATHTSAFIGVSSGRSINSIERCLRRHNTPMDRVQLFPAELPYGFRSECSAPFPTHPNYDRKAWAFLEENIEKVRPPVLFWNVGAGGTGRPVRSPSRARMERSGRVGRRHAVSDLSKQPFDIGGRRVFPITV